MTSDPQASVTPGGYREVLRVAWPLVVSMGSFTLMQFCDRMFLAWYSADAIQAALPAGILSFTMICGFMALAGYAGTFVAHYHGAGDRAGCGRATAQGVLLALASWPFMLALMPIGQWALRLSGHAPGVLRDELAYFNILMIGSVATPLGSAVSSYFTGRGDTVTNMYANLAANVANIALDYAMIFGRWGFPEMGIAGAAWATVISGFLAPAIMFALYFRPAANAECATRRTFRLDRPLFLRMIRFGLPSAGHLLMDVGSFTLFVLFLGRFGRSDFAASNIALSINNVAFMPLIGISIAASILVGQYQGRGDSANAEKSGWTALKVGWMYMALIAATFVLFPRAYFSVFAGRGPAGLEIGEVLPTGRFLLAMMAAWGMMDAINLILSGALKGAGDTRFVMWYSVIMAWGVWLTGELIVLFVLRRGVLAAWLWLMAYVILMALGYVWRYRAGRWKAIALIEHEQPIAPARPGGESFAVVS